MIPARLERSVDAPGTVRRKYFFILHLHGCFLIVSNLTWNGNNLPSNFERE